jgi:outer membrane protein TolC
MARGLAQITRMVMANTHRTLAALGLVLWLTPAVGGQAGGGPVSPLTLDEATRLALANSRLVKIAQLDVQKAADDAAALKTRRRPNFDMKLLGGSLVAPLDFTFQAGSIGTFASTGPIPRVDTSIGTDPRVVGFVVARVAQPLTQLTTIGWGLRALTVSEDLAKEQVRAQEQTVRNRVQKLYYGLLQATSGLTANAEALTLYREVDRLVADYATRQVVLPAESLAVKATLAKQEQIDLVIRNTIATLKEQLNVVMGREIEADFSVVPSVADTTFDTSVAAFEARALEQRPDVRQARLRAQQAEFDLKRSRAAGRPEISLALNYIGFYNVRVLPRNMAAIGVFGSWEPWDWGRKKLENTSKEHTVEQAHLAVRETEDSVRVDVRERYRKVQETRAMLAVATAGQQTARERLRVATERYRFEASLHRQVLEGQAALADSDQQYQQAVSAFWSARADFERAVGGDNR